MHKKLLLLALLFLPLGASAQVFSQNQVILPPLGSNGFVVSTSTSNGAKLSATSTPYFANFFAGNGTIASLKIGTLSGVLKATAGTVSAAANGTDYTLITAKTCTLGDFLLSVTAAGVFNCGTPTSVTPTVATSSVEGATQVAVFSSTAGTPALIGGNSGFTWSNGTTFLNSTDASENFILGRYNGGTRARLGYDSNKTGTLVLADASAAETLVLLATGASTIPYASSTAMSANSAFFGGTATTSISSAGTLTIQSLTGILKGASGVVSAATLGTDYINNGSIDSCSELAAITGTTGSCGSFVLSGSPTLTGTITAAAANFSGNVVLTNATSTNMFAGRITGNTAAFGQTASTSIASDGTLTIQTLSGLLKATTGAVSAASAGTDYVAGGSGANTQVSYFTAAGVIAGDAGMTYSASADRLTVSYASTTGFSSDYASSTNLIAGKFSGAGLADCDTAGSSKLLWDITTGLFSCGTDQTSAGGFAYPFTAGTNFATGTAATSTSIHSGGVFFASSTVQASQFPYASTTMISATSASTTNLTISSIANSLLSTSGGGVVGATTVSSPLSFSGTTLSIANAAADGSTKGAASFTANDFDATTGNISIDYTNGQAASGSNKGFLTSADWTTFNNKAPTASPTFTGTATFANLTATAATSTNLFGGTITGNTLAIGGTATTTIDSAGNLTLPAAATFAGAGLADCDTAATSKLLWDVTSKLFSCGTDQTGAGGGAFAWTPTTYAGVAVNATSTGLWLKATSPFSLIASSTFATNASSTQLTNSDKTWLTTMTSALLQTDANGLVAEYAGSSNPCTNQVPTTLTALAILGGCVSISDAYLTGAVGIAHGGLGAAFTDPNADQLMFWDDSAGSITGIATLTGASISGTTLTITDSYINNNGDTGTGNYDFGGATVFEIPNGTAPTLNQIGQIALDTTSNNLILATSTNATSVVFGGATTTLYAFQIASTSPDFASGGIQYLPAHFLKQNVTAIICQVDGGTSQVINLSSEAGSSDTNTVTCTTTSTQYAVTSNFVFNAYAVPRLEYGTKTGSPDYINIRIIGYRTSD